MGRLDNKVAIITGAAGGQGKAEAMLFAQEGAKVVATDLDDTMLAESVAEINWEKGSDAVVGVKHDIASESESDWVDVVAKAVEAFGKVDILINNAAIPGKTREDVWDIDAEETSRILNRNIIGTLFGIKAVMPEMKKNGGGSIVNICAQSRRRSRPSISRSG